MMDSMVSQNQGLKSQNAKQGKVHMRLKIKALAWK
jgi:hypothetical protein